MFQKNNQFQTSPAIILGGFLLAAIAGSMNVIILFEVYGDAVTHMTGNLTRLSKSVAVGDLDSFRRIGVLILAFISGAIVTGFVNKGGQFQPKRRYGLLLITEGILIGASAFLLMAGYQRVGEILVAFASGLQNALVSLISGAIIRTTHMTGILTDLGAQIGIFLKTRYCRLDRILLQTGILFGFLLGGFSSAIARPYWGFTILFHSAALLTLMGLVFLLLRLFVPEKLEKLFRYDN